MSRILQVLVTLVLVVNSAQATPDLDGLYGRRMKGALAAKAVIENGPEALTPGAKWAPTNGNWSGDPNQLVCEGNDKCVDPTYEADKIDPSKGNRQANINYYGSMMGFQAGMDSEFHSTATIENYLKGKLTLAYITMGLTEPAIAAGLAQAVSYIGNDVSNRLQGEQLYFSQLQYMPDVSEVLGQAHMGCISDYQRKGFNWVYAQAACSGDRAGTPDEIRDNPDKFTFDTPPTGPDAVTSFKFDPNWDEMAAGGDAQTIKLSDYLFNRDITAGGGIETAPLELKRAFVGLVGDIEYSIDDSASAKTLGTRQLTYKKVIPTAEEFEKQFKDRAKVVHAALLESFRLACEFNPGKSPGNLTVGDPFLANKDIWAEQTSYPGFSNNLTFMRMLWELAPDKTDTTCPDYEAAYGWDEMIRPGVNHPDAGRDYMYVAQRIAFGRTYGLFILAEQYIRKLNSGAFDNFARKAAFELLYESAGTTDLHSVFDQNAQVMRDYVARRSEETAKLKQFGRAKGLIAKGPEAQNNSTASPNGSVS